LHTGHYSNDGKCGNDFGTTVLKPSTNFGVALHKARTASRFIWMTALFLGFHGRRLRAATSSKLNDRPVHGQTFGRPDGPIAPGALPTISAGSRCK
jgi:hypothetical protein